MEWPIFFKDSLLVGSPESNVGICILWMKKEALEKRIPKRLYHVMGNLYTTQGINPMVKNILSNPKIRHIVVCGPDLTKSGDAMLNFMKGGMDSDRKIIGSSGYIDSDITDELLESFRRNVEVIDARGKENMLTEILEEASKTALEPFMEPVFLTELKTPVAATYSEEVSLRVSGKSISETWLNILDLVLKFGEEKKSEYGLRQKEVINIIGVIEGGEEDLPEWMNVSEKDIESYYRGFFSPEKDAQVDYTYGERLFKYSLGHVGGQFAKEAKTTINQVKFVINKIKEHPYTRRAVAVTWKHEKDPASSTPPCLTQITWNVGHGKLHQTAVFRSHDIFGAWVLNIVALRKLQELVARETGMPPGFLTVISNSAHIYENYWQDATNLVHDHHHGKFLAFEQDRNGYFIIGVDEKNKEIVVEHFLMDGRSSGNVFKGRKAQTLYRKIINENLVSKMDHAAYLGHELARAQAALEENEKFVQDEA